MPYCERALRSARDTRIQRPRIEPFWKNGMSYKTLQLAFDSGIATLTLNRPDKRNAISYELIDDLIRALEEARNSSAGILILTGAGEAFLSRIGLDKPTTPIRPTPPAKLAEF